MACSGAPATTTCTVTNPVQLTAGAPASVSVTVTTQKPSLVPNSNRRPNPPPSRYLMLLLLSMCLAALAILNQLKHGDGFMPGRLAYAGGLLVLVLAGYGLSGLRGWRCFGGYANLHRHAKGNLHPDADAHGVQHERQTSSIVAHSVDPDGKLTSEPIASACRGAVGFFLWTHDRLLLSSN